MYNRAVVGRSSLAVAALVGLGFLRNPGCGGIDDPKGAPNAPCTRSSDCGGDLQCLAGVCREPDAGEPGTPTDAGSDAEADAGADAGDDGG